MKSPVSPSARRLAVALLALTLAVAGCAGTLGLFGKENPPTTPAELSALQAKAQDAWNSGRYERSAELYGLILAGQGVGREAKLQATERLTRSFYRLGRYAEALDALNNWATLDPKLKGTWEWNRLYVRSLIGVGRQRQAEDHLAKLVNSRRAPFELTGPASLELAGHYASRGLSSQAVQIMRQQHAKAPNRQARIGYESDTARMLAALDDQGLSALAKTVTPASRMVFPQCLVAFENLRRAAASDSHAGGQLADLAQELERSSNLTDRQLPGRILAQGLDAATSASAQVGLSTDLAVEGLKPGQIGVALLLPQTGQLRALAAKVLAGAKAAQEQASAAGTPVDLRVINTDDPAYVDQIAALPREVMLVGGPMHASYFKSLPASGELSRRVFLTFLPETPEAEEGKQVWRFFWSFQDEVHAVINPAMDAGVKRFGVLYPEDRMGKRLADFFSSAVTARGGQVSILQPYPPREPGKWNDLMRGLLKAQPSGPDGKTFTIQPDFQALFIPDSLPSADQMISYLHMYQANTMLVLGPQAWSESLSRSGRRTAFNPIHYRFAFCSGAWWPENPAKSVATLRAALAKEKQGEPDFWSALGYDFVRLAAQVGPVPAEPAPSPADVTKLLNKAASQMEWSMAPVSWNEAGQAKMSLFFFRPSVDGLSPVDKEGFAERVNASLAPKAQ
ncbi:penicillin-binding protein activator [Fundidesulfovibrio butyratiphilus]